MKIRREFQTWLKSGKKYFLLLSVTFRRKVLHLTEMVSGCSSVRPSVQTYQRISVKFEEFYKNMSRIPNMVKVGQNYFFFFCCEWHFVIMFSISLKWCQTVRPSVQTYQLGSDTADFSEIWGILWKSVEKYQISLKSGGGGDKVIYMKT
jgi:hypothetical protein